MATAQLPPLLASVYAARLKRRRRDDRRRVARVSVPIPVRLRPVRFRDGNFEDLTSTVNVSRGCLYVTTTRESYYQGMLLIVTYPYLTSGRSSAWEYFGEVARVEDQRGGRFRIAVRLQFVMRSAPRPHIHSL